MAPKRRSTADGSSAKPKRARKMMTLQQKIELLDKLKRGDSAASVGRFYGINESTVRTIKKNEASIRASIASGTSKSAKVTFLTRDHNLEKMEKALIIWMEDMSQKKAPLDTNMIQAKARSLHERLKQESGGEGINFQASKGWFENFKKRHSLHNVKLSGESASADHTAASTYPAELKALIEEKQYLPQQVFNADETGLFWKRMPSRTFISKNEKKAPGFKAAKDRLTLMFCGNASGDCFVKPMLLYRSLNPRALKGKNMNHLPVYWKSNKRAWVTAAVFMDWFHNCFVHEVEKYLKEKNLAFKVLLILDNAPGHPAHQLQFAHPNVEVVFLPPNTTSLLQPMDQGVIKAFKVYYVRRTFAGIVDAITRDPQKTVTQCWKDYNIADCLTNIKDSVDELKSKTTLNACWRKLWPEAVNTFEGFAEADEVRQIVALARKVGGDGFEDLDDSEVQELIASHSSELTDEDLEELVRSDEEAGDDDDDDEEEEVGQRSKLSLATITDILVSIRNACDRIVDVDPFMERSLKVKRQIEEAMLPYREVQQDLQRQQKQTSILRYMKPTKPATTTDEEPQPSTSGVSPPAVSEGEGDSSSS